MQEGKKGRLGTNFRRRQYVPMDDNMCSEGRYILSPTTICTKRQYVPSHIIQRQHDEARLAVLGRGEYTVSEDYKEYAVPDEKIVSNDQ